MHKKLKLSIGLACSWFAVASHADTDVKVFNQNIFAHVFCDQQSSVKKFKDYIAQNKFDFIMTQEYEGQCAGLFNDIKNMGYSIATGRAGDSTLFYKNTKWTPEQETLVDTTYNTADAYGHDGSRKAVYGVYQNKQNAARLAIGTAHLCVAYPSSHCVTEQSQAHRNDMTTLMQAMGDN